MFVFLLAVVAVFSVMVFLQFISTYYDTIEVYGNSKYGDRRLKRAQMYQQLSEQFGSGFEDSVKEEIKRIDENKADSGKNKKLTGKKQKAYSGVDRNKARKKAKKDKMKSEALVYGRKIAAYKFAPKEKHKNGNCKAKRKDSSHAGYSAANGVRRKGMYKHNGKGKSGVRRSVFKKKS